jgi:hypothetical protein
MVIQGPIHTRSVHHEQGTNTSKMGLSAGNMLMEGITYDGIG